MSQYQRRPVSTTDFSALVAQYYAHKQQHYEASFTQALASAPPPPPQHQLNLPIMPHHAEEENATGNLTDQVAKDSKDSTASTHPHHDVDTGAKSGSKATAEDHTATPGIVQTNDLPEAASKDELKKRAAELNK